MLSLLVNPRGDVGDALETLESKLDKEIAASLEESGEQSSKPNFHQEDAPCDQNWPLFCASR